MTVTLKRFSSFDFGVGIGYLEVFVNPDQIAYVEARRRYDSKSDRHSLDGTRIYFNVDGGILDVRDETAYVVAALQSGKGGVCRDCYQLLDQAWCTLCADCAGSKKRAELAAEDAAAEEAYRDMLRHPETVVDAPEAF